MREVDAYARAGVNYEQIDLFKRQAQAAARGTAQYLEEWGFKTVKTSYGESAFVWEEADSYRALVVEGLGTKGLLAEVMTSKLGRSFYEYLAQDSLAMILNDLITCGAVPLVVSMYAAAGESRWFADQERGGALVQGWEKICRQERITWGGGESPTLRGVISSGTVDLAGAAVGMVRPKERLVTGEKITDGDVIVLVESSGIHANGLSLVRQLPAFYSGGLNIKLESGQSLGEALLKPTHIYARLQKQIFEAGVDIHYMINVTGHGWRKLMRVRQPFTYVMENLPPVPEELRIIQKLGSLKDRQMYETFNMGAGFAFIVSADQASQVQLVAAELGYKSWQSGRVVAGEKRVVIEPISVVYSGDSLQIR